MIKRFLSVLVLLTFILGLCPYTDAADSSKSPSQKYVEAMGQGWNLGNSFDGFDADLKIQDHGETAWGNPAVTRELIHAVKEKGYDSIRIPLTLYRRYTEENGAYTIDADWLKRYKEVVDWSLDEGLYVMVNIHHDSWIWLKYWNGDTAAPEYIRFVQLWEQLGDYLKGEPAQVCFETINEPQFDEGTEEEKQAKLDALNLAAYKAIRESGGNNSSRMIVMPTLNTNHEKCGPLLRLMQGLHDDALIATVHYYSEWVYSANLGITGFDEPLGEDGNTPRKAADSAMNTVYEAFTANGIGVVIGEYGLLGYDAGTQCNQLGEELKYYEYMNELSRKYGVCLMFWDNGSGIDRTGGSYPWKKPLAGAMLEASMAGRSAYSEGLDTLYFSEAPKEDIRLPLTLNGNTFVGIDGLSEGTDYTYDREAAAVTLKSSYIRSRFAGKSGYGTFAELALRFSEGADWHEKLVKLGTPVFHAASGAADGLTIPAEFYGADIRRISACSDGKLTGPNADWWKYLQHTEVYQPDYEKGTLTLTGSFFKECAEGAVKLEITFYDGQSAELTLLKNGDSVSTEGSGRRFGCLSGFGFRGMVSQFCPLCA